MKITRLEKCEKKTVAMEGAEGVVRQVPIGKADGAPHFSVRVFTVAAGGHTPRHAHESEHVNYILSGEGQVMDRDVPRPVREGDFVFVPPNQVHQYRNTGTRPLVFMCMVPVQWE